MEGDNIGKGAVRFYVVVLSLMSSSVSGLFVVEKNSINVIAPDSLRGKRQSAIGNFGVPDYGGTMIGKVVYPEKGKDGCKSFEEFGVSFNKSDSHSNPVFFLIYRGDCYFALKVWNAKNAGAAAILVADDHDEPLITMDSLEEDKAAADYPDKISIYTGSSCSSCTSFLPHISNLHNPCYHHQREPEPINVSPYNCWCAKLGAKIK